MSVGLEQLLARLRDESPEVRRRAVTALADAPSEKTDALLLEALADRDWRVRKEAVAGIVRRGPGARLAGRLLDAAIQDDEIGLRNAAAEALAALGEPAVTTILERLPELDPGGRIIALEVVGASGDPRAMEILVEALDDEDPNVRVCVAEWLGEQTGGKARDALIERVGGDDRLLGLAALQSLNRMGAVLPWSLLEPLADGRFYGSDIVLAMGRSGDPRAAAAILAHLPDEPIAPRAFALLHDSSPRAARAVEIELGKAPEEALDAIAAIARSGDPPDQRSAVRCLLWSERIDRMPLIVELAQDESLYPLVLDGLGDWGEPGLRTLEQQLPNASGRMLASVVGLLANLLDEESGRSKATLFAAYLSAADLTVATAAAGAIARFGDAGSLPRLLELTRSESARVRRTAGHALTQLGRRFPKEVRRQVTETEISGRSGVELCRVLEAVGEPEDAAALSGALSSPDSELRQAALRAVAAIAGPAAVDTISLAMTDEDIGVRMAAADALARIGPAASETIVSGLRAADGPLRAALVRTLGRVGHPEAPEILKSLCRDSADVALAALEAMQRLELDPVEIQDEILGHPDSEVVKKALLALGHSVSGEVLARLLDNKAWDVRLAAVERLAQADDSDTVVRALKGRIDREEDDLVRDAMRKVLRENGGKEE
ncbi:MAG: HEAT repeat domain-containing protein [Polyangia bacterium]